MEITLQYHLERQVSWSLYLLTASTMFAAEAASPLGGTHVLQGGQLRIEVMDPNALDRYNRGVRFTQLAAVLRVTRDGHEFLYAPAIHDPIDDHGGLATEFDLCIPGGPVSDLPSGFSTAAVNSGFLKIGVGVLTKGNQPYNLFQHPALIEAAHTSVTWAASTAQFHQISIGVDGYAYELWADIAVIDDHITIAWRLANCGIKPFTTRQYSHNFFRFDEHNVGPDYTVTFPYDIEVTGLEPEQQHGLKDIRFVREIPHWVNMAIPYPSTYHGMNSCRTTQTTTGLSVLCDTSLPGLRTAIHARPAYLSPEQFIQIELEPGHDQRWVRTYTFEVAAQ